MHATYTQLRNIAVSYIIVILVSFTNLCLRKCELNFRVDVMLVKEIQPSIACVLITLHDITIRQCHVYIDSWEASSNLNG